MWTRGHGLDSLSATNVDEGVRGGSVRVGGPWRYHQGHHLETVGCAKGHVVWYWVLIYGMRGLKHSVREGTLRGRIVGR